MPKKGFIKERDVSNKRLPDLEWFTHKKRNPNDRGTSYQAMFPKGCSGSKGSKTRNKR